MDKTACEQEILQLLDFTIEADPARDFVVLQLTDTQIIDAAQKRTPTRIGGYSDEYWATDKMDERCFNYLREIVEATKPDLILHTGDIVYGEFDDAGTSMLKIVEVMESFKVPWAPVFGNHDNESKKGADWQSKQLEKAEYCMFKQRTLTGNGNYTVGITGEGVLKRVFFMLDSNGCGAMSEETKANGHSHIILGFGQDQIEWYTGLAEKITALATDVKYSFVFHIQPEIFRTALSKYAVIDSGIKENPVNIDRLENKEEGDFGYIGSGLKSTWDTDFKVFEGIKALGCDSIIVGHEHCNSASVVHEEIRFQYGQKISCFDRANYMREDGSYVGSYNEAGTPVMGGTVMEMSPENGKFNRCYIYYCNTDKGYGNPGDIF